MPATAAERRRPLTPDELERLRAVLFPRSERLVAVPLLGGIATATYGLTAYDGGSVAGEAVLRCYRGDQSAEPAARVNAERRTLEAVAPVCPLAPRALYADADGVLIGEPLLVMSRLRGVPARTPRGRERAAWIGEFARGLASVHAVDVARLPEDFRRERDAGALLEEVASHAREDPLSRDLLAALRRSVPVAPPARVGLVHHDYWFGNTLWTGTRLTGIVDFAGARIGDRAQDVAYARSDCALFIDLAAADDFRRVYDSIAGPIGELVWWDLFAALLGHTWLAEWLVGYQELGVDMPLDEARRRIAVYAEDALRRSGSDWHVTR